MPTEHDSLKEHLNAVVKIYPDVELEASIMKAVRKEVERRREAQLLRRRGWLFLTIFLSLLALALWLAESSDFYPAYRDQVTNFGLAMLFILIFFAQLEAWWSARLPTG